MIVVLITLIVIRSQIYLHRTDDGPGIDQYDCVIVQPSLSYCRRPVVISQLSRGDNDTQLCVRNGGEIHLFSELRSKNITTNTLQHQWTTTLERVEEYALYLKDRRLADGHLCRCLYLGAFGKNCEYQLPVGQTFEETLKWQLIAREKNPMKVQAYANIVCYQTLTCDSGLLCLDWREICDGIQQCLEGKDEENCDLLEMNQCDPEEEYRCSNGMCIPDEFFVDGERDCLDWSDELLFSSKRGRDGGNCPSESVSTGCDDHLCRRNTWSCGDGQCIPDRMDFQRVTLLILCINGRDSSFFCETTRNHFQWTMPNGLCYISNYGGYLSSPVSNRSDQAMCVYLLKCALSVGTDINCRCNNSMECEDNFERLCPLSLIQYPRGAVMTPFTFFFYNRTRDWRYKWPDMFVISGTVRCRGSLVSRVTKFFQYSSTLDLRLLLENQFCRSSTNVSIVEQECHHENESTDRCGEWNRCLSVTRIRDGVTDCVDRRDELTQSEMDIDKSCARVRRHRFRCSHEQPTCFTVIILGDGLANCRNRFDELWFGVGRQLSSMNCNEQRQDECLLVRQYIEESWKPNKGNGGMQSKVQIPFRSYCDTLANLETGEDEDLLQCQQWWICSAEQSRCENGQCFEEKWREDGEWDCADASDELNMLRENTGTILNAASQHDFTNQSYLVPSTCPAQSSPFLCFPLNATRQGFECFNLSQIGDGRIDCLGAFDEQNTMKHCSQSFLMLALHFRCSSTNTCIPFWLHCRYQNYRCPNRSDDQFWCDGKVQRADCSGLKDFVCFDGQCAQRGRCNLRLDCLFGEDEYMCDYWSERYTTSMMDRSTRQSVRGISTKALRFSLYPADARITQLNNSHSLTNSSNSNISSSSLSPYQCNRALGVVLRNETPTNTHSIVCFCPPQYFGIYCQFHSDRVSVILHLDLSESSYVNNYDAQILLKLVVLFIFNGTVLERNQFHVHPFFQLVESVDTKKKEKIISHFVYPHSNSDLLQRRQRFFNRSSLLHDHLFVIRIELYRTRLQEEPALIAVWKYPIPFDYLPVTRLAKVLRLPISPSSVCSSQPCRHPNERCHPLLNNKSQFVCLCATNYTGENCSRKDPQCDPQGYCLEGSLCRAARSGSVLPFCVCPSNRYGRRCSIEHSVCLSSPCQNNGSCFPDSSPDRVICLCTREYSGDRCQWKRASIHLSILSDLPSAGVVIQFFTIDTASLDLVALHQQAFKRLPRQIDYFHRDQTKMTGVVLAKLYSSHEEHSSVDLHLLSVYADVFSLRGRTEISQINRCAHVRSSPIRYHRVCQDDPDLLCFRDDVYLCVCAENHTRVECFLYNDELDRCPHCLAQGRCLKGNLHRSNDFVCLCPACHSGRECQFNTKFFSFTLDQLFSPDFDSRRETIIAQLLFFSLLLFVLALPNNLFSFVTLLRPTCRRYGVGHYLLAMTVVNQLSLALLIARLVHLIVNITGTSSSSSAQTNDVLCKSFNYLLSSSSRLVYWLTSLISIERLYTTLSLRGQWLKQPRIARRLIIAIFLAVFITDLYEVFFYKSFSTQVDGQGSFCVLEISTRDRSWWMGFHLLFLILHSFLPFLINLSSTIIITFVVINKKIKTHKSNFFIFHHPLKHSSSFSS